MSTIQTQISLVHLQSGLNLGAAWQRASSESSFTASAVTVTNSPEALALGDISVPRQVILKLISGDPLLVSLDGGTAFPLSLNGENDSMLLALECRSVNNIACADDSPANAHDGEYFDAYDVSGPVRVWINTSGGSAAAPAAPTGGRLLELAITSGDDEETIATKLAAALNADGAFVAVASGFDVVVYDAEPGVREAFSVGTLPFTITDMSTPYPSVYFVSLGSTQLAVGIAPV